MQPAGIPDLKMSREDYALSTSTTSFGKIRGFTVTLLFTLENKRLRTSEIAELTGKTVHYVWRYLSNMRKYGLAEKKGCFWVLTHEGRLLLDYFRSYERHLKRIRKNYESYVKEGRKKIESREGKRAIQTSFELWLRNSSLDDTEKEVVEALISHYSQTGSKFILVKDVYELAYKVKSNPQTLTDALRNLRQDNIIYLYRSKDLNCWKIGLKKQFIQTLQSINK